MNTHRSLASPVIGEDERQLASTTTMVLTSQVCSPACVKWIFGRRFRIGIVSCQTTHHRRALTRKVSASACVSDGPSGNDERSMLVLSPTSWPEPNATAAGTRTMSLLRHFSSPISSQSSTCLFDSVHFGCGANMPQSSSGIDEGSANGVNWHQIKPNRSNQMRNLIQNIEANGGPIQAVIFDRFYAEEAFSFKIREECPTAVRILDMQDVHSLRLGRQCIVEELDDDYLGRRATRMSMESDESGNQCCELRMTKYLMDNVMKFDPASNLQYYDHLISNTNDETKYGSRKKAYDTFLRELASVHRSDLVLVCSSVEMELLEHSWNVPRWKLVPAPFFCIENPYMETQSSSCLSSESWKAYSFDERTDFVTVGGLKHPPNIDSIKLLRYEIWPKIRAQLPNTRLHVYGAYPTKEILSMHSEKCGFLVHGQVDDLDRALVGRRVLLAPLRFGAGIKGKIVDAWRCGCPVITTPVGAEGMMTDFEENTNNAHNHNFGVSGTAGWGGIIASDSNEFVSAAVRLYTRKDLWGVSQENGSILLNKMFNGRHNLPIVEKAVRDAIEQVKERRLSDITGALMWHQCARSTEYFSRWIELKESALSRKDNLKK